MATKYDALFDPNMTEEEYEKIVNKATEATNATQAQKNAAEIAAVSNAVTGAMRVRANESTGGTGGTPTQTEEERAANEAAIASAVKSTPNPSAPTYEDKYAEARNRGMEQGVSTESLPDSYSEWQRKYNTIQNIDFDDPQNTAGLSDEDKGAYLRIAAKVKESGKDSLNDSEREWMYARFPKYFGAGQSYDKYIEGYNDDWYRESLDDQGDTRYSYDEDGNVTGEYSASGLAPKQKEPAAEEPTKAEEPVLPEASNDNEVEEPQVSTTATEPLNASTANVEPAAINEEPADNGYGLRNDGTPKGRGYLGEIQLPNGDVATEYTIGVDIDGKEVEIPTLVPTLTEDEVALMRDDIIPNHKPVPRAIAEKAIAHAKQRMADGLSVFIEEDEEPEQVAEPVAPVASAESAPAPATETTAAVESVATPSAETFAPAAAPASASEQSVATQPAVAVSAPAAAAPATESTETTTETTTPAPESTTAVKEPSLYDTMVKSQEEYQKASDELAEAQKSANADEIKLFSDIINERYNEKKAEEEEMARQDKANRLSTMATGFTELGAGIINMLGVGELHAANQQYHNYSADWMKKADQDIKDHRARRKDMRAAIERLKLQQQQVKTAARIEEMKLAQQKAKDQATAARQAYLDEQRRLAATAKAEADARKEAREERYTDARIKSLLNKDAQAWAKQKQDMLKQGFVWDGKGFVFDENLAKKMTEAKKTTSGTSGSSGSSRGSGDSYSVVIDGRQTTLKMSKQSYEHAVKSGTEELKQDIVNDAINKIQAATGSQDVSLTWDELEELTNSRKITVNGRRVDNPLYGKYGQIIAAIDGTDDIDADYKVIERYVNDNKSKVNNFNKHLQNVANSSAAGDDVSAEEGDEETNVTPADEVNQPAGEADDFDLWAEE